MDHNPISDAGNSHILQRPAKRRGRPKGSQNKPKTEQPHPSKSLELTRKAVLHIKPGSDVVQWLHQFCCSRKVSLTVLSGSGSLYDVILHGNRHMRAGPLKLESVSGTFRPVPPPSSESCFQLRVMLVEGQGYRLYDRMVSGKAADQVTVEAVLTKLPLLSSELNNNAHIKDHLSNTSEVNDEEKSLIEEDARMEMKSNNDDEQPLSDAFWVSLVKGKELFDDDYWNSFTKRVMEEVKYI